MYINGRLINYYCGIVLLFFLESNAQSPYHLYDINNNLVKLDTSDYIIILMNNKNCITCFSELSKSIENFSDMKQYCIVSIDSSVLSRKKANIEVRRLMPNIHNVIFDYRDNIISYGYSDNMNKNSIFYKYKVDITPALIISKKSRHNYIPYRLLFTNGKLDTNKLFKFIVE